MYRLKRNLRSSTVSTLTRGFKNEFAPLNSSVESTVVLNAVSPTHPDDLAVMIFGSSTDVGKTIISAGLSIAAMRAQRKVCYIKPVQTGHLDEYFVQFYANPRGNNDIFVRTLQHWKPAMSPHLAANMDERFKPQSDPDLLTSLTREMRTFIEFANVEPKKPKAVAGKAPVEVKKKKLFTIVETAGGVLSPGPNKSLQADVYRSLRLPIVLVGDARLGGISSTVSAFESLRIRGYTVHAVVLIGTEDPNCSGNAAMLEEHFQSLFRHVPGDNESAGHAAWSLGRAPKVFRLSPMPADQQALLHGWYRSNEGTFASVLQHVSTSIADEWKIYLEMSAAAGNYIWWPFTQHANLDVRKDTQFIESAHGDNYRLFSMEASEGDSEGRPLLTNAFDASASWWTQAVGHGNSHMSIAIGEAAGRYGHIIFPRNLHAPVAQLSRYLIEKGPGLGWAERVFYSDNGSTAMEIALKMAFRLHELRHTTANAKAAAEVIPGEKKRLVVVSQRHGYHGDTLGTMNTSSPSAFNKMQHPWYACSALVLDIPTFYYRRGHLEIDCSMLDPALFGPGSIGAEAIPLFHTLDEVLDTTERMASPLAQVYRTHIVQQLDGCQDEIGALVLEPMMLGAGGLTFLDPLFQKVLISECKARNVPVVFDEVAVGMYRLGPVSTSRYLQESPDIACYGKMLSGGYIPLAVTLASHEVFSSFLGDTNSQALMHGHSYTANPIACTAALEAIRLLEHCPRRDPVTGLMANMFGVEDLISVSKLPGVASVMGLGSVLSIQLCARGGNSSPPAPGCSTIVGSPVAGKVPPEEKCLTKDDEEDEEDSVFAGMSATQYNALYASFVVSVLRQERLFARPLGNTIYIMTTPFTTDYDRQRLLRVLRRTLTKTYYMRPTSFSPASTDDEDHKDGQESGDVYFEKNTTIV